MRMDIAARCGREIVANLLMGIAPLAKLRTKAGRTSSTASEANVRRYAFGIILDNPSIQPLIRGSEVLEIGPGDHLATGLSFLAYGAKSYTALDRFPGNYRGSAARQWYELVREQWGANFVAPWPAGLEYFPDLPNVRSIAACIEDESKLPIAAYDLIVSQAVGEHVRDITAFALATYRMLKPGGTAVHIVDFSCHGFFPEEPLRFLTIPDKIWEWMGSNRGLPNRRRIHEMEYCFRLAQFQTVEIIDRHAIDTSIPQQLANIPKESALTDWAVFCLRK